MRIHASANISPPALLHSACPDCGFIAWSLPASLPWRESQQFLDRVEHRRPIARKEHLHRAGAPLRSLYIVNDCCLRSSITDDGGREQVTGFFLAGDLVGMDAIGGDQHQCDIVALGAGVLCGIAYSDLAQLTRDIPALQRHFHRVMGAEITRNHDMLLLLVGANAEQRVARFVLDLSQRLSARGLPGTRFRLAMSRQDIASYLGLKTETVSRIFSHFSDSRLIAIKGKNIELGNLARLRQIAQDTGAPVPAPYSHLRTRAV